jgi:SAM-dependent methyltransferase
MAWYREWFGEDYLKVYPHRDQEEASVHVNFLSGVLPLPSLRRVLDLGCGSGRHAVELGRRGLCVICLDLSTSLLRLARKRSLESGLQLPLVRSDMRNLPFRRGFDAVMSFFTTFGYFESDEENLAVIQSVADVLKPGGFFVLDYLNQDWTLNNLVPRDEGRANGIVVVQERRFDSDRHRLIKKITLEEAGQVREYLESVRVYNQEEIFSMLRETGLSPVACYGDWAGESFDRESPRMILISQSEGTS